MNRLAPSSERPPSGSDEHHNCGIPGGWERQETPQRLPPWVPGKLSIPPAKIDLHGETLKTRSECNIHKGHLWAAYDWLALQRHLILRACLHCSTIQPMPLQRIHHTPKAMWPHEGAAAKVRQEGSSHRCARGLSISHDEAASVGGEESVDKMSARAANNLHFTGSGLQDSECEWGEKKKGTVVDITLEWEQDFVMHLIEAIPTTAPYAG